MIARGLLLALAFAVLAGIGAAGAADLRTVKVLDGKVEISVPAAFTLMSEDQLRIKYPSGTPPKEVYADETGAVNVGMKVVAGSPKIATDALVTAMATGIDRLRKVTWHDKGKRTINGHEFGFLEFTAAALDTDIYNYIYFTQVDGELLMFTFNSTVEKLPLWKDTIGRIVSSTKILPKP